MNLTDPTSPGRPRFGGDLPGATQDRQSITADWQVLQGLIEGVLVREVRHVPTTTGVLTEIFRVDWGLDNGRIGQVFQKLLWPGCLSAWHVHPHTTDRLFVNLGLLKIVLYDARAESATRGAVNEFVFGAARPALVVIPPGVWHGVLNTGPEPAALLNLVDHAYCYEAPDHWRLPPDSPEIPFRWGLPSGPPPAVPK